MVGDILTTCHKNEIKKNNEDISLACIVTQELNCCRNESEPDCFVRYDRPQQEFACTLSNRLCSGALITGELRSAADSCYWVRLFPSQKRIIRVLCELGSLSYFAFYRGKIVVLNVANIHERTKISEPSTCFRSLVPKRGLQLLDSWNMAE